MSWMSYEFACSGGLFCNLIACMAKILVVDDEAATLQMITGCLQAEGHEVHSFRGCVQAMEGLEEHYPELVITDLNLDQVRSRGLEVLRKARSLNPPAEVIVVTAFGSVESAVETMRDGAYDYVNKPFSLADLKVSVQRALSYHHAVAENHYLKKQLRERYQFSKIVGTSAKMQSVFRIVERVADTDSTVLILGESGTGKELVARALHFNSRRQFAPFVPINCAALPEHLLESELFGHRKGSFAGAITDKVGLFQEADGGTIFLDEIGSMPAALQSRLLRVLQDREVRRVGDNNPVHVNVRVLAATHEPLEEKIKAPFSRGPLLPVKRDPHPPAQPAGAARGHPIAGDALPAAQDQPAERARVPDHPAGRRRLERICLAGQRPRARKRDRAPHRYGEGAADRARRSGT